MSQVRRMDSGSIANDELAETLKRARRRLAKKDERLKKLREQLNERDRELAGLRTILARRNAGAEASGVRPESMVWIFGNPRSGSTWLSSMMGDLGDHTVWHEPLVGELFGHLYYVRASERHHNSKRFILGRYRQTWLSSIKNFILEEASARFPQVGETGYLVVKEPNGSIGAPLLMEALPESRMIFLVRDPRDVVASALDAHKEGSWVVERRGKGSNDAQATENPERFAAEQANRYVQNIGNTKLAYDSHTGRKFFIRYEDLRADTLGTMRHLYAALQITVYEADLARVVEKHSWENIPEVEKGEGKFYRKASPGSWREDLTPKQARVVEEITAPLLKEFYPEER
jgi:hypothetical protein